MKRVILVSVIILLSFSLSAHNPYAAAGYPVRPYLPEPVHHRDPHHDYNGEVTVLAAALDVPERNADAILSLLHHVRMSSERRGRAWDEMRAVIRTLEEIYTMREPRGAEDRALREFSQVMDTALRRGEITWSELERAEKRYFPELIRALAEL